MKKLIVAVLALMGVVVSASAQENEEANYIAVEAGWFFPTDGLLRDRFDSAIFRFGLGPVFHRKIEGWRTAYELGFIGASQDGNRFLVIPLTVGVQKSFGNLEEEWVPYARAAAGIAYVDYDIDSDDGKGFSPVGTIEFGVQGGSRFRASLRYTLVGKKDGIDFSGTTFGVSYGLFKF